jgi:histidine triad (HIT) family protein
MDFTYDPQNIFARILRGEIPNKTVFENAHALAFHDIAPQAPIHVLVIPKGAYVSLDHFARDASAEEHFGFMQAVAEVCKITGVDAGFRAISNTRTHGRQDVPHYHLHILGGRQLGLMLDDAG